VEGIRQMKKFCPGFTVRALALFLTQVWACVASLAQDSEWGNERYVLSAESIALLTNADVDWVGNSLWGRPYARPTLVSGTAKLVQQQGLRHLPEIMKLLDRQESFIVAHVLLTDLWRVPKGQWVWETKSVLINDSDVFSTDWNGLKARLTKKYVGRDVVKSVDIPDMEKQFKTIREFWLNRFRDHPKEFSSKAVVIE
jgi:hypothetical protein